MIQADLDMARSSPYGQAMPDGLEVEPTGDRTTYAVTIREGRA